MRLDPNRRDFLKITAGAGAALAMPTSAYSATPSKMIGIQVGAVSFVDEGTEKVLDVLQERACVNTLFLAVFTYGRGIAGRQIPGQPGAGHGGVNREQSAARSEPASGTEPTARTCLLYTSPSPRDCS